MTNIMTNRAGHTSKPHFLFLLVSPLPSVNRVNSNSSQFSTLSSFKKVSLNQTVRKQEKEKIENENQAILQRLRDRSSVYNVYKWEADDGRRKKLLKNMCEYPYSLDASQLSVFFSSLISHRQRGVTCLDTRIKAGFVS